MGNLFGAGHSALLRTLAVGSLNRRICAFASGYAQISRYGKASHIPEMLYVIAKILGWHRPRTRKISLNRCAGEKGRSKKCEKGCGYFYQ